MEGASPVPGQGGGRLHHRATSASSIHVPCAPVQGTFGVHLNVFSSENELEGTLQNIISVLRHLLYTKLKQVD